MFMIDRLANHSLVFLNATSHESSIPVFDESSSSSCDFRTIWTIVRSCLVTISLCTWTAAHPNITGPNGGRFAGCLARGKIAVEALLTPELIVAWAMQQWLVARRSTKDINDPKWTMWHGYLLSMGGFMLQDCPEHVTDHFQKGDAVQHPLSPDEFLYLLRMAYVDMPDITKEEIKDKSKGDALSKALTVIQTGWFVMQCIARWAQRLSVTELELATVAFALTNTASYLFWWNKPLNVHCTVPVTLKRPITKEDWRICMLYIRGPQLEVDNDENSLVEWEGAVEDMEEKPKSRVPPDIITVSREGLEWPIVLFESVRTYASLAHECELRTTKKRVHRQYAGNLPQLQFLITFLIAGASAVTFGAIHCLAWSSQFPSYEEKILWRVCCMVMIGVPFWLAGVFGSINLFHTFSYPFQSSIRNSVRVIRYVYILARIAMLVEMFISLRSLTPSVYRVVKWTTFIPHI